jgi:hypothetical protein
MAIYSKFEFKLLIDGRELPKTVNYALVEIVPPTDLSIDTQKRPLSFSIRVRATGRASAG